MYFILWEACIKQCCTSLKEHATNVINFERKKNTTINKKELKLHRDATAWYFCGKRFSRKFTYDTNYQKVRDHCYFTGKYRGSTHNICNLKFNVSNEIPVVFHSGSNYDYHFIIKELANKLKGQFQCLWENVEKYKTFSIPVEKEIKRLVNMAMKV